MKRSILHASVFVLSVILLTGAQGSKMTLEVSLPAKAPNVAVPVEAISDVKAKSREVLEAVADKSDSPNFLLQEAPALFQSPESLDVPRALCAVLPPGVAGRRSLKTAKPGKASFSFVSLDGGKLQLLEGDRPVLVYNYGMQLATGVPEDRRRSSYIHPLYDLDGRALTDDFPSDHHHHRGLSWMWPRVSVGGQQHDLWHIRGIRHIYETFLTQEVGPGCATLGVKNAWQLFDPKVKVLDEWVWVRVFPASEQGRVIDVRLTWRALEPVQIVGQVDTGYGGLSLRLVRRQESKALTSTGLQTRDSDLQPMAWADLSGKFGGSSELAGISIFQHAGNPGFPAGWTLRRADNYGFLGVAWPGLQPVTLEPNRPVTLRYRLWVHRGDAQAGRVEDAYAAFLEPPSLRVTSGSPAKAREKARK
jgi:hypothetical protein